MHTILIGVSSGIAAFKVIDLVERLKERGYDVIVLMTDHAKKMLSEQEFERASGNPVASELFPPGFNYQEVLERREVEHISLAERASVICIAPATANILAKISHGIADDLLTTTVLATQAALLFCPSMNVNMWNNDVTQENINSLKQKGCFFVPPEKGPLACGYEGTGRLASIDTIEAEILKLLRKKRELYGKHILVTAGGTEEEIDPVRVITNKSSGKMGIRIAEECVKRGADVTLIRARTAVDPTVRLQDVQVRSAQEMLDAIQRVIAHHDAIVHAAAVSDFTVKNKGTEKLSSAEKLLLELIPNVKIIDAIKQQNEQIRLIGFKAEHDIPEQALIDKASAMLQRTGADLVVANDVGQQQVFGADENEVLLVKGDGQVRKVERTSKQIVAERIVDEVAVLLNSPPISEKSCW